MPPFDLAAVTKRLQSTRFAGKLQHFATIDSTNLQALAIAQESAPGKAPDGIVLIADEQTAGRGRGGHTWHSAPGDGLYLSAIVQPRINLAEALWISLATGLAAQRAIAEVAGLRPDIRWPNDLLLPSRKCGGILVETASNVPIGGDPATLRHAVIGIGINVNHEAFSPELSHRATSLRIETGRSHSREALTASLLLALDAELYALELELRGLSHSAALLERFTAASTWVTGKRVRVDEAGGYTGTTAGLDSRGFLLVRTDEAGSSSLRTVLSGGVRPE